MRSRLLYLLLLVLCLLIPSTSFEQGLCMPSTQTSLLECAKPGSAAGTPGTGTVTSVGTGFGLTGGTIVATGTVSHIAPLATDQVYVSDSTSGATWRTIPDCQGTGKAMTFTAATNLFGCNTIAGGGVTSIIAGTGISVDASTGDVTVTNTGGSASYTPTRLVCGTADDTIEVQAALDTGTTNLIYLPHDTTCTVTTVTQTQAVRVIGDGDTSKLVFKAAATGCLWAGSTHKLFMDHVFLDGGSATDKSGTLTSSVNRSGLCLSTELGSKITSNRFEGFENIALLGQNDGTITRGDGLIVDGNTFVNNVFAVHMPQLSEYNILTNNRGFHNGTGLNILGGNNTLTGSAFNDNGRNLRIAGTGVTNNSHCNVTGGTYNHGVTSNIEVLDITLGCTITGVDSFAGKIIFTGSVGALITSSILGIDEYVFDGAGYNEISNSFYYDGYANTVTRTGGATALTSRITNVRNFTTGAWLDNTRHPVIAANMTNRGVVIGSGNDTQKSVAALTDGQVLIGSTGADPVPASLTAGTNITLTPSAGGLTIASASGGSNNGGTTVYSAVTESLSGTRFFPIGGGGVSSTTETDVQSKINSAGTITNTSVVLSSALGASTTAVFTWRINAADTTVTCTITDPAVTCSDVTHTATLASGDLVDVKVVYTGTIIVTPQIQIASQIGNVVVLTVGSQVFAPPGLRLSLSATLPLPTTDVSGGTVYYIPYMNGQVVYWDGAAWQKAIIGTISSAVTLTAASNLRDVFVGCTNATTCALVLSAEWTNSTTRADALGTKDGVTVLNSDKTKLWIGTLGASAANIVADGFANRLVCNVYNKRLRPALTSVINSHAYATASYREWNGGTGSLRVSMVNCEDSNVNISILQSSSNTSGVSVSMSIGLDSATVAAMILGTATTTTTITRSSSAEGIAIGKGYRQLVPLEFGNTVGTTAFQAYKITADIWN